MIIDGFITENPDAVFVKHTHVKNLHDSSETNWEGFALAKEIFAEQQVWGVIAIKPNLTGVADGTKKERSRIITDADFVEGLIEGMSVQRERIYIREGVWMGDSYFPAQCADSPYVDMAERTGIHLTDFSTGRKITDLTYNSLDKEEVVWKQCPEGVVFEQIGYVAPFNRADSWLLNVAKFKTHGMGMSLCCKNLQGMCINPHIHFCEGVIKTLQHPPEILGDFQPDFDERVGVLHGERLQAGVPRWDKPGEDWNSGYGMEMWAQRTCDNISVTNIGLNIIEGISARDGDGFLKGPGPDGKAQDFLTNILIFGVNPFHVDIIGHWLGGHEPRNFGLFHIAKERGLCSAIDPDDVPLYLWEAGRAIAIPLEHFERTELLTPYLRRDYDGQTEQEYHLVNEAFDMSLTERD